MYFDFESGNEFQVRGTQNGTNGASTKMIQIGRGNNNNNYDLIVDNVPNARVNSYLDELIAMLDELSVIPPKV